MTIVTLVLPDGNDSSHVQTADGQMHIVEVDDVGRRIVRIPVRQAQLLLNSGMPSSVPWREANWLIAQTIATTFDQRRGARLARCGVDARLQEVLR
jgi:hypothetical protein